LLIKPGLPPIKKEINPGLDVVVAFNCIILCARRHSNILARFPAAGWLELAPLLGLLIHPLSSFPCVSVTLIAVNLTRFWPIRYKTTVPKLPTL